MGNDVELGTCEDYKAAYVNLKSRYYELSGQNKLMREAIEKWWEEHRPVGWSRKKHAKQYWINCNYFEKPLAKIIACEVRYNNEGECANEND